MGDLQRRVYAGDADQERRQTHFRGLLLGRFRWRWHIGRRALGRISILQNDTVGLHEQLRRGPLDGRPLFPGHLNERTAAQRYEIIAERDKC